MQGACCQPLLWSVAVADLVAGCDWCSTSVFFKVTFRPKCFAVSAKQSNSCCTACCACATSAQSSANKRSRMTAVSSLVLACSLQMSHTLLSVWNCMFTPRLQSLEATSTIVAKKKMLNRSETRTHPCLVTLMMSTISDSSSASMTHGMTE